MSVIIMGLVWEADLPQREKLTLLAYADHADHEGNNVFPSVGLIAWKTGYSKRSIQRITKVLVDKKILIEDGDSRYGTNKYKIDVDKLPKLPPYGRGVKVSPTTYGGVILSGGEAEGDDKLAQGGDKTAPGGDTAMSPEPSLEPSLEPPVDASGIFSSIYESEIGALTPMIGEELGILSEEYPVEWFERAVKEAIGNNVRKLNYVKSILKRWKTEGFDNGSKPTLTKELERKGYVRH
jgi:DnaD/phage-associated family protein